MTRVQSPNEDDLKKLGQYFHYLWDTKDLTHTLKANDMATIQWRVEPPSQYIAITRATQGPQ